MASFLRAAVVTRHTDSVILVTIHSFKCVCSTYIITSTLYTFYFGFDMKED